MENEKTLVTLLKTVDGREVNLTEYLADHPALVIGADKRAGLQVMGAGVEAAHAVVTRRGSNFLISPRVPAARVLLNGQRINLPTRLNVGDTVQLGFQSLTVAQSEVSAVARVGTVMLPAIVNGRSLALQSPITASTSMNAVATALDRPREIYFPRQKVSGGMSLSALLSGIITVLVVAVVIGYGLVTSGPASATDITSQFAYKDGHITVVMFDADW